MTRGFGICSGFAYRLSTPALFLALVGCIEAYLPAPAHDPESMEFHHAGYVMDARYSHDGRQLATSGSEGRLKLWDVETRELMGYMRHGGRNLRNEIFEAVYSPDDSRIATRNRDGTLKLWNTTTFKQIGRTLKARDTVGATIFSADGSVLYSYSHDGIVRALDTNTAKVIWSADHDARTFHMALSASGLFLLTGGYGSAKIWDAETGELIATLVHDGLDDTFGTEEPRPVTVANAVFVDDDRTVVTADYNGIAKVWSLKGGGTLLHTFEHDKRILSVDMSDDETLALTSGLDGVRLWDVTTGEAVVPHMSHDEDHRTVLGAILSPDEMQILSWGSDLVLWDAATGERVSTLWNNSAGDGQFQCAEFSKNGDTILAAYSGRSSRAGQVRLYDVHTSEQIGSFGPQVGYVQCASFVEDERKVLSYSNTFASLWDVETELTAPPEP